MIKINLLPYREAAKKENLKRQITIIAGSFVIVILALTYIQLSVSSSISTLEEKIKEKEARLAMLTKKLGDIEGLKRDIKDLEQKLAVITNLEENRLFPVRVLDEFTMLVPSKDMWLEKMGGTGLDLRIDGIARNNIIVSNFMKRLELSSIVSSVNLLSTRQVEVSGFTLLQFSLSCVLRKG